MAVFLEFRWQTINFEEDWISAKFYWHERHIPVHSGKPIYAVSSFGHMSRVGGQHLVHRAGWALEFFLWSHLDWSLARHMSNQKVHGYVLTVHLGIYPFPDTSRKDMRVPMMPKLMVKCSTGENHRYFIGPL